MTQDVAPPGTTPDAVWTYVARTLTGFTGTPRSDLVGSDAAIWAHATRELTKHKAPFNRAYVCRYATILRWGYWALAPLANATDTTPVDVDSSYSITDTYVERLNQIFLSDIAGVGVLRSYEIYVGSYRSYIGTLATTYYYKMSIQPIVLGWNGVVTNLEAERDIYELGRPEEATAGWYEQKVRKTLAVDGLSLTFDGILGIRLKTYSRSASQASGSENGMGFEDLNHTGKWSVILRGELEV